jgi:hypothetical protein
MSSQSPRRETAGGFSLLSSSHIEQNVLAKRQTTAPSRISVRYYLWSAEGPQRITERLHRELFERNVAIPPFAGTKQRVLEVFVQRLTKTHYSISGRGIVYPFDDNGFLDVKTLALEGPLEISRFRSSEVKIVDLNPSIRRRRFQQQYTWKPSKTMLDDVWCDIEPRRAKGHRRLPLLRSLSSRGIIR